MKNNRRILKNTIGLVLVAIISISEIAGLSTYATTNPNNQNQTMNNAITIEADDSLGELIANELNDKEAEQAENNGYNIYSVDMEDNIATVTLQARKDCTVVVGIYDEEGVKLLASGIKEVHTEEKETQVNIDTEEMPEYYYVKAFLIETDTLSPLCTVYNNPNYTQSMQEFFALTTEDFEEERVLNFDEDITNNFAVYDENTKLAKESDTVNTVSVIDNENNEYVISNIDDSISGLSEGDIFAYEYGAGEILITKVAAIDIDGDEATITGEETTLNEVFEYVKISEEMGIDEAELGDMETEEGLTFEGVVNEEEVAVAGSRAIEGEYSVDGYLEYSFKNKKYEKENISAEFDGGFYFWLNFGAEVYINGDEQYVEAKFTYSFVVDLEMSGEGEIEISLAKTPIKFNLPAGIRVSVTPAFAIELDITVTLYAKVEGVWGLKASSDTGIENISTDPTFSTGIEAEGTLFIGIVLKPEITFISKWLATVEMEGRAGVEFATKEEANFNYKDLYTYHKCVNCTMGDVNFVIRLEAEVKFFNNKNLTLKLNKDFKVKICDFYYRLGGWFTKGCCPNYKTDTCITVLDAEGKAVENANIYASFTVIDREIGLIADYEVLTTDNLGAVKGFLPIGTQTIMIDAPGYRTVEKALVVGENRSSMTYRLKADEKIPEGEMISVLDVRAMRWWSPPYQCGYHTLMTVRVNEWPRMLEGYNLMTLASVVTDSNGSILTTSTSDCTPDMGNGYIHSKWPSYYHDSNDMFTYVTTTFGFIYEKDTNNTIGDEERKFVPVQSIRYHQTDVPLVDTERTIAFEYTTEHSAWEISAYSVIDEEAYMTTDTTKGTAEFTDLVPDKIYNVYILKSDDLENVLSQDNLLYINQGNADEDGNLSMAYEYEEVYEDAKIVIVGVDKEYIDGAEVTLAKLVDNGEIQNTIVAVTYNGKLLEEGIDYIVSGDYAIDDCGTYTIVLTGMGHYTGTKEVTFEVPFIYGDCNNDNRINVFDAVLMKKYIAGFEELEINIDACDVNVDSRINVMDAVMTLRYIAGFDVVLGE